MLSIGKLGDGGARYYTERLGAVDEYYREAGSQTGVWTGVGAELLGLEGPVDPVVLCGVLGGGNPGDGAPMAGSWSPRSVPGFDLCFRAPKSVSLLQALGDPETRAAVLEAHRAAVRDALGYVERDAILVRRGHAGAIVETGAAVVGAVFEHFTSRAGDPHLHSHVLVANMSRGPDGRWSALDGRALYRQAKTAGFLYEASLRRELTLRLGVVWGPVINGIADVGGVPKSVIETFSTRRSQIVAELARNHASSPKAAQVAALATRPAKDKTETVAELRAGWERTAEGLGWGRAAWQSLTGPPRDVAPLEVPGIAERLLGPEGLTEYASTFDGRDLLQAVAGLAGEGATVAQIDAVAAAVLADERAIRLPDGPIGERWTTTELLEVEGRLIDTAAASTGRGFAVVDEVMLDRLIAAQDTLSAEQKTMIASLCRSGDGVQVVIGVAGAGKTYALGVARSAWELSGVRVVGTALSARAAKELSDGARIASTTIARLLTDLDNPIAGGRAGSAGLGEGSVLVVDEAAMVSTRHLARLAEHARRAGAKLVLVGDDRQLPAIGAGGAFSALADRLGALELLENRRQAHGWERTALDHLRAGRAQVALAAYHSNDRRHHVADRERLRQRLVADWSAARADGTKAMMLATRRDDVEALNRHAREQLRDTGKIGPDIAQAGGRGFAVGDEVICTRNDRHVGVINGTRAVVVGVDTNGGLVVVEPDGRRVVLPTRYLGAGHVAHGYATTIHKAQGATTERTFILADEHLYREAGYVALSRGRDRNDLYTTAARDPHEGHGRTSATDSRDPLAVGLGRSRAQQPAGPAAGLPGKTIAELLSERHDLAVTGDRAAYRRIEQLEALIAERKHALGLWAVDHPSREHLQVLGEAPRSPERQAEWARAAGEISAYREQHGIAYTREYQPDLGISWWEHHQIASIIREVEPALDLSETFEKSRDRDLGLGL